jgi:hypothetical protein
MLRHIDGFDQFQGQSAQTLLSALQSAGYAVSNGLGMAAGRKAGTYALELQVSAGAAGAAWSARTNTIKANLNAVAANSQGRFVAVGDGGVATTTTDGISWATLVLGVNKTMRSIECNAGTFIAVGDLGTILRSTDGQAWSQRSAPNGAANFYDVACSGSRWLAVGNNGGVGCIIVSDDDGMTWATVTENSGAYPNLCVEYGDCWMVGGQQGQVLTSADGLNFTNRAFGSTGSVNDIAFFNGTWLAVTGADVRRSTDSGINWIVAAAALSNNGALRCIAVSDGRWVAGGDNARLFMSDDGSAWTVPAFAGASNNAIYDINTSSGAQVGWCLVGARSGQTSSTATIYVSLAPPTAMSRTFTSTSNKVVIGFAHQATARGRIFSIKDLLDMDWPAGIQILGVAGASVPIRNTWYYYEIEIDKQANKVRLYVNDTLDIETALPAAGLAMTTYTLTWQAENGAVAHIDDLYLLDADITGGSTLTGRLKPISVALRLPTADTLADWDASQDGPHFPLVGLLPPSTASYVRSATSGEQDLYTSNTALPAGAGTAAAPIIAVGVVALAQKSDLDNRQLGLVVGEVGNQKEVIDTALSTTPEYSYAVFEKAPGDQPWTADNVQSLPFGIAVRP